MYRSQRDTRSPVDGHLDDFQFFAMSNKDTVNMGTLGFATFSKTTSGTHFRELSLLLASFLFLQSRENYCYLSPKTIVRTAWDKALQSATQSSWLNRSQFFKSCYHYYSCLLVTFPALFLHLHQLPLVPCQAVPLQAHNTLKLGCVTHSHCDSPGRVTSEMGLLLNPGKKLLAESSPASEFSN